MNNVIQCTPPPGAPGTIASLTFTRSAWPILSLLLTDSTLRPKSFLRVMCPRFGRVSPGDKKPHWGIVLGTGKGEEGWGEKPVEQLP